MSPPTNGTGRPGSETASHQTHPRHTDQVTSESNVQRRQGLAVLAVAS
jgi:hypothetical protein